MLDVQNHTKGMCYVRGWAIEFADKLLQRCPPYGQSEKWRRCPDLVVGIWENGEHAHCRGGRKYLLVQLFDAAC